MTLAQLGADVIRIDPIGGNVDFQRWPLGPSGFSLYWAGLNKAKRSVALALHTAEGQSIAQSLITASAADAGILLTNLPPNPWSQNVANRLVSPESIRLGARSLDELRNVFDRHRVLWGPYQDIAQLMKEDPRCSLRNPLFQRVNQSNVGEYLMPGSPLCFDHRPHRHIHPAPGLGAHTDEVLKEILGCSDQEIRRLRNASIVA